MYILYFCALIAYASTIIGMSIPHSAILQLKLRSINSSNIGKLFPDACISYISLKDTLEHKDKEAISLYDLLLKAGIPEVAVLHAHTEKYSDTKNVKKFLKTFLQGIFIFEDDGKIIFNIEPLKELFAAFSSTAPSTCNREKSHRLRYSPFKHAQWVRPSTRLYQGHWFDS